MFARLKGALTGVALAHGVLPQRRITHHCPHANRDWRIEWKLEVNRHLVKLLLDLGRACDLCELAQDNDDKDTVHFALIEIAQCGKGLAAFFSALSESFAGLSAEELFCWPPLPAGFEMPVGFRVQLSGKSDEPTYLCTRLKRLDLRFDRLKFSYINVVQSRNLGKQLLYSWSRLNVPGRTHIDLAQKLDSRFMSLIAALTERPLVFERALHYKDYCSARQALQEACHIASDLTRFFEAIWQDFDAVASDRYAVWPPLPNAFTVPEKYRYWRY